MKARQTTIPSAKRKKGGKTAINLSLSDEAQKMAKVLKKQMMRSSITNVCEVLILEKAQQLGLVPQS